MKGKGYIGLTLEQRVKILEDKMAEVERFIFEHIERENATILAAKYPNLLRGLRVRDKSTRKST